MKTFFEETDQGKKKPLWYDIAVVHYTKRGDPPFLRSLNIRGGKMKVEGGGNNKQWVPDRGISPFVRSNIDKPVPPTPGASVTLNTHITSGTQSDDKTIASEYGIFENTVHLLRTNGATISSVQDIRDAINAAVGGWSSRRKANHIGQVDRSETSGVISNGNL